MKKYQTLFISGAIAFLVCTLFGVVSAFNTNQYSFLLLAFLLCIGSLGGLMYLILYTKDNQKKLLEKEQTISTLQKKCHPLLS